MKIVFDPTSDFECINAIRVPKNDDSQIFTVKSDTENQYCTFCGNEAPTVSFQKRAHLVPEGLGNKALFTANECDSCNKFLGARIDNDFLNAIAPFRALSKTKGKQGRLKIQASKHVTITSGDGGNRVELVVNKETSHFSLDGTGTSAQMTFEYQRYRALAVPQQLARIGMLMDPSIPLTFKGLREWILGRDELTEGLHLEVYLPHTMSVDGIAVGVFRHKKGETTGPKIGILVFGQIYMAYVFDDPGKVEEAEIHLPRLEGEEFVWPVKIEVQVIKSKANEFLKPARTVTLFKDS